MVETHREKPYPEFPLNWHSTGYWYKRITGKVYYFGPRWGTHEAALEDYLNRRNRPEATSASEDTQDVLTVQLLCNYFLAAKQRQKESGELSQRSWNDYFKTCKDLVDHLGRTRSVEDMSPEEFGALKTRLAEGLGVQTAANRIRLARIVFRFAEQDNLIEGRIKFGTQFKQTSTKTLRKDRQKKVAENGTRQFTPQQIKDVLECASPQLKAMIYLGINCAYGNTDVSELHWNHIRDDWAVFPRPKTAVDRLAWLWPETVKVLEAVRGESPRVFSRRTGASWVKVSAKCVDDGVSKTFAKLMQKTGHKRLGLSFYSLRHTFQTVADDCLDPVAVGLVMGHTDSTMAARYRERVAQDRVRRVCEHVRNWLINPDA